ncbi:MAG: NTP transferase domain-containing protein [Alphaproteobacteria bacterium]|nr:NTP transferase domain-containing protein [Alphaproteobacteria bacterium]
MQCLILAGGLGDRMKPATETVAKALLPVCGRPFADYQLTWLAGQGVTGVVYAIGHKGGQIRDFAGDGGRWGLEATYSDEGETGLGTGGAVRLAVDHGLLGDEPGGGFLVLYGDSYLSIDIGRVWAASDRGARPLMCVHRNDGRWDASNAVFEDGHVTRFEKGLAGKGGADAAELGMDCIDYGLSVLTGDIVREYVPAGVTFDLADVHRRLAETGELLGFEATERFYEIGSPEGLADLEAYLGGLSSTP